MIRKIIILGVLVPFLVVASDYTANHSSVVTWIKIYNNDQIYFGVEAMPINATCNGGYFALKPELTEKQRDRYYSMLLAAKTTKTVVSIGYDKNSPDCINNIQKVHALAF